MNVLTQLTDMKRITRPVVLAAGFFDGVHRGHQRVIARARARARACGGEVWILTFDRHPLAVLRPDQAPALLTGNRHKRLLLERQGVDGCLLLPFTRRLAGTEPEDFVARLVSGIPRLSAVLVGPNWRFGRHGRGTPALLAALGRAGGFAVQVVGPASGGGRIISSTRVRRLVARGRLTEAAALLGRPYSVLGTVTHGRAVGRQLGFPTANLRPDNEVLPPCGVYAVAAAVIRPDTGRHGGVAAAAERLARGVLNFGRRPTFAAGRESAPCMEVHLLDEAADLYGRDLEVFFLRRLRAERRFDTPEALARQIARDTACARRVALPRVQLNPA